MSQFLRVFLPTLRKYLTRVLCSKDLCLNEALSQEFLLSSSANTLLRIKKCRFLCKQCIINCHGFTFQVYNKYLELQYNIKSDDVKKRSASLSKDKTKNFGHLVEALNLRSNFETQILNQTSNSETSSPTGPPLGSSMELDQISMHGSASELPTTSVQTVSQASTPRDGTTPRDGSTGLNGLVFHLATPPRENTRSPTPLLESFL